MRVGYGLLAAGVLSGLLGVTGCGDNDGVPAPSAGNALPALEALHATRGAAPAVVDAAGRQVLLRAVNFNALGDYFQGNPAYPPVLPLDEADFGRMARYGFNAVRLVLSWSALEPAPGVIDPAYVGRIRDAVAAARAQGLYTVLDMHQDAWGKFIASPAGTTCPSGREPAIGWDGAPEWATFTDGRSTCRVEGSRELSAAVARSFASFYADREGIQQHLVAAWAALAREFAQEPAVAGYDVLNEPHYGERFIGSGAQLVPFYRAVIDAIRAAERAGGGFSHIVFFEPAITWPLVGDSIPPADVSSDPNLVFSPHNYAESITALNSLTIEEGFARAVEDAAVFGTTFWIGEYGWFSDPPANKARLIRYAKEEDRLLVAGAWWQWNQACGDPHSVGKPGGDPPPQLIHFGYSFCPGDVDGGPVPEWVAVLSRPFPRAAPGRLVSLESDGDAITVRLSGRTDAAGTLDLWMPQRAAGLPVVSGRGVSDVRTLAVDGGFRVQATVNGEYEVTGHLAPAP